MRDEALVVNGGTGTGHMPVLRNGVNLHLDVRYWGMETVQQFVKIHGEDRMAHLLKVIPEALIGFMIPRSNLAI